MNLFIIAWNPSPEDVSLISSEMHRMKAVFPMLDPNTLWSFSQESTVFAASMHIADEAARPRIYVKQAENHIVFFDGCMVDQSGCFPAYDAEALASHWNTLPDVLEGHYTIARIQKHPASLEIINDPLGIWQTYYLQRGNQWFISNSSNLLSRIGQINEWDPLGLSLYLSWGWAGSDRTLRRDIRVMPAGQHWRWDKEAAEPSRKTYFQRGSLSNQRQAKLTPNQIKKLAADLSQTCKLLTQSFPIYCPITAGRDSRLLAAILLQGEMAAKYFVTGAPENIDVQIGSQISKKFNLPFHIESIAGESNDQLGNWIDAGRQWVVQKDGLFSLKYFVQKSEKQTLDHLAVIFDGGGGGIAKGAYSKARFLWRANSKEDVEKHLNQKLMWRRGSLLRKDAIAVTEKYLSDFIVKVLDEGFSLVDIPDVLYTYERVSRWAGNNISLKQHENKFMPLCTRPFITTAFSIPAQRRYTQALHYQLLKYLVPELHRFPFEEKWRFQQPMINCLDEEVTNLWKYRVSKKIKLSKKLVINSNFEGAQRLELKRNSLREFCLDQINSVLWDFVDRASFERQTAKVLTSASQSPFANVLWDVATVFLAAH